MFPYTKACAAILVYHNTLASYAVSIESLKRGILVGETAIEAAISKNGNSCHVGVPVRML